MFVITAPSPCFAWILSAWSRHTLLVYLVWDLAAHHYIFLYLIPSIFLLLKERRCFFNLYHLTLHKQLQSKNKKTKKNKPVFVRTAFKGDCLHHQACGPVVAYTRTCLMCTQTKLKHVWVALSRLLSNSRDRIITRISDALPGGECGVRPMQGPRLNAFKQYTKIQLDTGSWSWSKHYVHLGTNILVLMRLTTSLAKWLRRPPRERKIPGSNPACAGLSSGSSHTSDLKIGTPVATLPGAWRYRVSAGTGQLGVSILWLGEIESLVCNFYLSVAARAIVWADPSLTYTRMLLGRSATNKQTNLMRIAKCVMS